MAHHNWSVVKALIDLFPNIGLDHSKFGNIQSMFSFNTPINDVTDLNMAEFWATTENRRKLFENYAKEQGFDPLIPKNWHNININSLLTVKVIIFC